MPRKKKVETINKTDIPEGVKNTSEKEELSAFIEELKRKDPHQFAIREAELLNKLKEL